MYFKITGMFIILLSTCSIGYIMGEREKKQVEIMSSLRRCISIVESEVRYMGTEMGKIFEIISDRDEEWSDFFGKMSEHIKTNCLINKEYILSEKITEIMKKDDRDELIRFICEPCGHDRQKELDRVNAYADRLDTRIKMFESDVNNRIKMMRILGFSSGVFLILLII